MNQSNESSPVAFPRLRRLAALLSVMFFCLSGPLQADDPPATGFGNAAANEVTNFKGTLKGMQRGILQVTRDDGTDVMVQLPAQAPSFTFVAEAKAPFLQRGMLVRFGGTFSPTGTAIEPIDKVEIFQPVNLQGVPGHSRDRFVPGVHPADKHAGKKKPVGVAKYTVVGSLMGINGNGAIMVQAGKIPVVAPLAQTASFEIRFHNLSLAQEGDVISVAGFYEPSDETKIRGDKITVTTDRIYGEPQEAPPRRSRRVSKRMKTDLGAENAGEKEEKEEAAAGSKAAESLDEAKRDDEKPE